MDILDFKAKKRETVGVGPAKALRRDGRIPAVLYGPKTAPMKLSVDTADFQKLLKDGSAGQMLINLAIEDDDAKPQNVMIKELQKHPMTQEFIHVDFLGISMDQKINVSVPVITTGKSKGVEFGGILQIIRRELEVFCYPNQIPGEIVVDITDLDVGESVHVEDLELEGDVEVPADVNFTILTILAQKAAEEEEEEEEIEGEGEEGEEGEAGEEEASEE